MSAREAVGEEAGVLIELVWFRDRADLVSRLRGCHLELGAGVAGEGAGSWEVDIDVCRSWGSCADAARSIGVSWELDLLACTPVYSPTQ